MTAWRSIPSGCTAARVAALATSCTGSTGSRLRGNPGTAVAGVTLRRGYVEIAFACQLEPVLWWHHDLDRFVASLRVSDRDLEAWPQWHALRAGGTLFNCGETATACTRLVE
jgi:hypothetical protein